MHQCTDDILGVGSVGTVQRVIRNTREMEVKKKFRFSAKKSKYMVLNTAGHDIIKSDYILIEQGNLKFVILTLFNNLYEIEYFPKEWSTGVILSEAQFAYKPGYGTIDAIFVLRMR